MFESQSNTVSLLQPSVPQVPLFLHPLGWPPVLDAQLLQPIFSIYKVLFPFEKERRLNIKLQSVKILIKFPIFVFRFPIFKIWCFEWGTKNPRFISREFFCS